MLSDIENLTIMFTDIVGFSNMVSSLSRKDSQAILRQHDKMLQKIIKQFGGQIIKSVGDSFLVIFRSPTDSILCAMAMQDKLWEYNLSQEDDRKIIIRIALNTGEVRLSSNDVFGDAVNLAARLESETPAGDIFLTESVYLSMNRNEVELEGLGQKQFKGITNPISIYRAKHKISPNDNPAYETYPYKGSHKSHRPLGRSFLKFSKLSAVVCTAAIVALSTWWLTIKYTSNTETIVIDKVDVEYGNAITQAKTELSDVAKEISELDTTIVVAVPAPPIEQQTQTAESRDDIEFPSDITGIIRDKAIPLVKAKKYPEIRELVASYYNDYPNNAYLKMLLGHADMHFKNYEASMNHYSNALDIDPILANDKLLSTNLVKLLEHQRPHINRLIGRYMSEPMIAALTLRSGQSGLRGRYDAFYLLKDSGNADKIDRVGLNIWDLKELEQCSLKKVAIKELRRLGDTKALPALKEASKISFWQLLKYSCLAGEVERAIKELEAKA